MTVKPPAAPPLPDELDRLLRRLRMPYVRRAAPEVIATAASQRWEHAEVLRVLLAEEAAGRDHATISDAPARLRAAGRQDIRRLGAGLPRDPRPRPRTRCGPSNGSTAPKSSSCAARAGSGKSHFIEALGHLAIDKGRTVAWHTLDSLAALFRRHRADDSVNKAISKLIRVDLILIDDVGLLPVSADAADALFRVVDAAYEKRSIAISSNIHPSGFDELMPKTHGDRDRRPTPTSRARDHHRRPGQLPARPSDRRQGGEAPRPNPRPNPCWGETMATSGEIRWPPAGRNDGHQWGIKWPPVGRNRWPLTQWGQDVGAHVSSGRSSLQC